MNFLLLPLFFHVVSSACVVKSGNNTYDFSALNGTYSDGTVSDQFNYTFVFCGVLLSCGQSNATLCQASKTTPAEASLGRWDNTTAWTSTDGGVEAVFKNGDYCDDKQRRTSIVFTCRELTSPKITGINETARCEYSVHIDVPQSVCGAAPTLAPTPGNVTVSPTPGNATVAPTPSNVTFAPTLSPTPNATFAPTPANVTFAPTPANFTMSPTIPGNGTSAPTPANVTLAPSIPLNTSSPTTSVAPTTGAPTSPTHPTTNAPTMSPTTLVTAAPTLVTLAPTLVTLAPTLKTVAPTLKTAAPTAAPPAPGGLSTGAIVGIVLGGVAVIGAVAYCLMSRPASRPAYQPLGGGA